MSEKESAKKSRRHRSRAEADRIAIEYEASGLTREEFCRRAGIALKSLSRYVTRHRQTARVQSTPQLLAVEVAKSACSASGLVVVLCDGHRIEVQPGFDVTTLQQLVAALGQS